MELRFKVLAVIMALGVLGGAAVLVGYIGEIIGALQN